MNDTFLATDLHGIEPALILYVDAFLSTVSSCSTACLMDLLRRTPRDCCRNANHGEVTARPLARLRYHWGRAALYVVKSTYQMSTQNIQQTARAGGSKMRTVRPYSQGFKLPSTTMSVTEQRKRWGNIRGCAALPIPAFPHRGPALKRNRLACFITTRVANIRTASQTER